MQTFMPGSLVWSWGQTLCTWHPMIKWNQTKHKGERKKRLDFILLHKFCFYFPGVFNRLCPMTKLLLCCVASVVSDSLRPHRRQPTRLPRPGILQAKDTGVGWHCLLCMTKLLPVKFCMVSNMYVHLFLCVAGFSSCTSTEVMYWLNVEIWESHYLVVGKSIRHLWNCKTMSLFSSLVLEYLMFI